MMLLVTTATLLVAVSANLDSADYKAFSDGSAQFGLDLYKEALKCNFGNVVVSPISASIAMALANAGANGETSEEIVHALHLPNNKNKIEDAMKDIIPVLTDNDDFKLTIANKMYLKRGYDVKNDYKTIASTVFDSDVENVNFEDATEAVSVINKGVEEQTDEQITDILKTADITADTEFLLLNAPYLNANWSTIFKDYQTTEKPFHINDEDTVDVKTMRLKGSFNYYECDVHNITILEMPYEGDELVMAIILPNKREGLTEIESNLDDIFAMAVNLTEERVEVQLPKFRIESTHDFNDMLQNLGVVKAFGQEQADFSGIVEKDEQLYINKVIQKTFIQVEERGTEAGAAQPAVININVGTPFLGQKLFYAHHPFMFVVTHKPSGLNLFIGKVTKPELIE